MRTPHGTRSFGQLLVFLMLGMCVAWALMMVGCSSSEHLKLPPTVSGQLPADYKLELARGIALARIVVTTQGEPGLGPFTNPLYIQLHPGEGAERGADRDSATVSFPPPGTYVFSSKTDRPSLYRYEPPGLMAVSVLEGMYDGLAIAYPDMSHETATPSSIPQPSSDFAFTAINIPGEEIVYLGDIEIRQTYSGWDAFADKVDVVYAVTDNYERTTADFRARYPQFADTEIKRRVVVPWTP